MRIAVPNKGSLSEPAVEMLREAGYRVRRDSKELIVADPDNDVEFFYLRPRDVALYVGKGQVGQYEGARWRVVEAVIDGIRSGCRDRDIDIRLIGIMSRTFGEAACLQELEGLLAHRDGITALDLAGDELGFPGSLFLSHFNRARDAGLRITVHAGEAAGPESIWQAIRELGAERIGHGVKAVEDPALMDFLAEHGIGIESCLTSNIQTSTVPSLGAVMRV